MRNFVSACILIACVTAISCNKDSDNSKYLIFKVTNKSSQPLAEIRVTLTNNESGTEIQYTNATGEAKFDRNRVYDDINPIYFKTATIEDIDGEQNGGNYLIQEIELDDNKSLYYVTLEKMIEP